MGGKTQNTNFQGDSVDVKGCSKCRRSCTTHLDSLNCVILQYIKEIRLNTYYCLLEAILKYFPT